LAVDAIFSFGLRAVGFELQPTCNSSLATSLTSYRSTFYAPSSYSIHPGERLAHQSPKNLTIATTGASGSIFLRQLLLAAARDARLETINFVASDSALRVIAEELGLQGRSSLITRICSEPLSREKTSPKNSAKNPATTLNLAKIKELSNADIGASVASGSYPSEAMIVIPCSVGTLARIANGIASHLIERAADVCLKEKRPLLLCVRETPLNKIHIRNMYRAADAGATIFPLIPAFYYQPASLDDIAREFAYRVLAHIGLPQPDAFRWKG
jgi:flavin prenyltransferase